MSTLQSDLDYRRPSVAIPHAIEQALKRLNTCLPGHIVAYDEASRRARIRAGIHIRTTSGDLVERPIVADVPVVWPTGGGFLLRFPLAPDDPVLLVFSQRGMRAWLRGHAPAPPDRTHIMSARDAIAIPGFGPRADITPGSATGASLQDEDANQMVVIESDRVRMVADGGNHEAIVGPSGITLDTTGTLTINADDVAITATNGVAHGGTDIGDTHVHSGVMTGTGVTGGPQ